MSDLKSKPRREFRNVDFQLITTKYRLPFAGKVSILHRVSGALLFLSLPLLITLFAYSVNPFGFRALTEGYLGFFVKFLLLVVLWGFMHHLCAGIRYLILDLHIGMDKVTAQKSAKIVLGVSMALTLVFAIKLFGVI